MKHLKNTKRGLEIATEVWIKDDEQIVLIGAMHIASEGYWRSTEETLLAAAKAGHELHLEGVKPAPPGYVFSPEEEAARNGLEKMFSIQRDMASIAGLTYQRSGMPRVYEEHETRDVSILSIISAANTEELLKLEQKNDGTWQELDESYPGLAGKAILWMLKNAGWLFPIVTRISRTRIMDSGIILDVRNQIAIDAALESEAKKRVLFWGAAHLPGMGKLLTAAGYSLKSTKWHVVIPKDQKAPAPGSEAHLRAVGKLA